MYLLYLVFVSYFKLNCDCWNLAVSSHWAKRRDSRDNQIQSPERLWALQPHCSLIQQDVSLAGRDRPFLQELPGLRG